MVCVLALYVFKVQCPSLFLLRSFPVKAHIIFLLVVLPCWCSQCVLCSLSAFFFFFFFCLKIGALSYFCVYPVFSKMANIACMLM